MRDRPARSSWALPAGVTAAILLGSLVPVPGERAVLPVVPLGIDAWVHLAGYAALAATLSRAFVAGGHRMPTAVAHAAVAAVSFGVAVELLQTAVPTRGFAWGDVEANAIGSALGGLGWWRSRRGFTSREGTPNR